MRVVGIVCLAITFCLKAAVASAATMSLDVVLSPKDDIRLDLQHDDRHFLAFTQREGNADGAGTFAGAKVVEYGMHDVVLGDGGRATGYLEANTTDGDVAYFKWHLRARFVAGADGKTKVINNGHWELIGGTGEFANMRGVGTLVIEFVSKTNRRYVLEGDISPAP